MPPKSDLISDAKWKDGTATVSLVNMGGKKEGRLDVFVEGDVSVNSQYTPK